MSTGSYEYTVWLAGPEHSGWHMVSALLLPALLLLLLLLLLLPAFLLADRVAPADGVSPSAAYTG